MKKHAIAVVVGFITFLLGCAFVFDFFKHEEEKVTVTVTSPDLIIHHPSVECRKPTSFPGISKPLAELTKFKNGYFPVKAFNDGWENGDETRNRWYGGVLRGMREPSLVDTKDENVETYRFLWLRSFHRPASIRINRIGYFIEIFAVELDGGDGFEPGYKRVTGKYSVTPDQWCEFINRLEASQFWNLETVDRSRFGHDGARWVLEGVKDGRYHIVDRWSPDQGNYREACLYLLNLTGRNAKTLGDDLY